MAAIARLQILQHSSSVINLKPSSIASKFPQQPIHRPCSVTLISYGTTLVYASFISLPHFAPDRTSILRYSVGNVFHVIAAHTDSPCLKLKPKSALLKSNYLMVNVQTYGGGLWHTWFDRDLSVAGRVILRAGDGSFQHKLVKVKRPLLWVPTLAIHLDRTVNKDGFKPNLETHLNPLLATKHDDASFELKDKNSSYHHPLLLQILSDELGCKVDDIANIELNICDTQPSCLGGANNEFIFSGRLDNLASSSVHSELLLTRLGQTIYQMIMHLEWLHFSIMKRYYSF